MKKHSFLSLLLVLALVLTLIPVTGLAADAQIALPNGDFENGTDGWSLTGYTTVSANQWASNNLTNTLDLWLSDSEAVYGCAAYTVKLTAGTYYFTFDLSGHTIESELRYSVSAGETVLVSGESSYTTGGWDIWQTETTASFTLSEDTAVTFSLAGDQAAGYWGNLDNLKLFGTGAIAADPLPQITLPNGDFENGTDGWSLTGYTIVSANQWASNNLTNTLDLWLSDSEAAEGRAAYSVLLTAGTYYFTFDLSGHTIESGLRYSVTAGDAVLASGESSYATGGWDVWQTETTASFTLTGDTNVTFSLAGTQAAGYWGNLDNLKLFGTGELAEKDPSPVEADIYVPYIKGSGGDFIRGMDVSSFLSVLNSGASFKDFAGNELDGQGFFNLLAASGTNWIRLRIWNDPFDAQGNGYGGGNNDVEAAKVMGKWATNAGMKVLIDFHYSDFWADPGKQQAPKAWAGYSVAEKEDALYTYTYESLKTLLDAGVDVGMVQVGNETTSKLSGVSGWSDICKLFSAGSKAIRDISATYGKDIKVAVHFTNPERAGSYASLAKTLSDNNVDYDVFASSWYPYWHGTLDNLTSVLKHVADTYGKEVIVAETSWAHTLEDGDGHDNTVRKNNNDAETYSFSVQGQADELAAVVKAVKNVGEGGIGVFYWESAWIPVQVYDGTEKTLSENKALWEQYGSGWASSYAAEYDPKDAGVWYGGSAWDNQAMFDFEGNALESLKTYLYIQTGTSGFEITVTGVESPALEYAAGDTLELPAQLEVRYSCGSPETLSVTWNEADVAAVDMNKPGTYTVNGVVGEDIPAVCTVTVKTPNLLLNPSFEDSDMSMYVSSQGYGKRTTDDPHSGKYSHHFYSSGTVDYTVEQTVTLQPGHYTFSLYAQGGNLGEEAATYAYVKVGEQILTADFALTGWAIWVNPTVEFHLTEATQVTVGANITASQTGAWGTLDDWYLCSAAEDLQKVDAKAATTEADGNIEYFVCAHCGKLFKDAAGTQEITLADTVIEKLPPADPTNPETGDPTAVGLLAVLLFASVLGIVVLPKKVSR